MALGAITLLTLASYLVLGESNPLMALAIGGLERWIVYPIVIWLVRSARTSSERRTARSTASDPAARDVRLPS